MTSPDPALRFGFGDNWRRFSRGLTPERIEVAKRSVQGLLAPQDLAGKTFLDVGSGSGLFSLAARELGARVVSFDYDAESVRCTEALRDARADPPEAWSVSRGSILDPDLVKSLGQFDIVYAWGVLHHTGDMRLAFDHVARLVAPGGTLVVAIYNDQGWVSGYWTAVKRVFNSGAAGRALMIAVHAPYLVGARFVARALTGRLQMERGMSLWYDMRDWLGGWPFEVARPEVVVERFGAQGFTLEREKTCGTRMGCNEFVFTRPCSAAPPSPRPPSARARSGT